MPESIAPRAAAAAPPRIARPATQRGPVEPDQVRSQPAIVANEERGHAEPADPVAQDSVAASGTPPAFPYVAPPAQQLNGDRTGQCTAPQLRRFIKSRPYVPMHELRRRFGINGDDDDVTPVRLDPGRIYVGLPSHEGHLLGELLRSGEIGYELSLDPRTPIVIGVYPMRPIPRG